MNLQPSDPLVHIIFVWRASVKPGLYSAHLPEATVDKLRTLRGRELIHFACELSVEEDVKHVDWVKSTLW